MKVTAFQVHRDEDHVAPVVELGEVYQVVLFNDNHNTAEHVRRSLVKVFGHPDALAIKIMAEAHNNGKTIAQVEDQIAARQHASCLQAAGLTVKVEKV